MAFARVGAVRGGLASVLGCAIFAAVSGSLVATVVTLGKVTLPEMKRLGCASHLATGPIAAGRTVGFLFPRSTGFVLYAILTERIDWPPVHGRRFAGIFDDGSLHGRDLADRIFYPEASLRGARMPLREKLRTHGDAGPLLGAIVLSIGNALHHRDRS